jgi:predicted RNA-binding Zn-ribbon protein involved in translation (DUF1610 family)
MTGLQPATMESKTIVRHACPKCGTAMLLERNLRTFECPKCEHSERRIIKYT